jgi:membrane-associated protease RseP (regulator of RpoE activity)
MTDPKLNRSWTIAAVTATGGAVMLSLGLFLAVGKDSLAEPDAAPIADDADQRTVKIVSVSGDDAEAMAAFEADVEGQAATGGYIGLSFREDTKSSEGGALVTRVVDESPASKAGIKKGDVVVGFGGDVVRGPAKMSEKIRASKPGDKVVVDVRRDGKVQKITVELAKRPTMAWHYRTGDYAPLSPDAQMELERSLKGLDEKMPNLEKRLGKMKFYGPGGRGLMIFGRNKPLLGIEMIETTPELRDALGGSKDAGVLVGKVLPGSAAEKGGLRVGDLILSVEGKKVSDPSDLAAEIEEQEGKTVDLDVVRDKKPMKVKAVLPKIDEPEEVPTGPRASTWRYAIAPAPRIVPVPVLPAPVVLPPPAIVPIPTVAPRAFPAPPVPPVAPCAPALVA